MIAFVTTCVQWTIPKKNSAILVQSLPAKTNINELKVFINNDDNGHNNETDNKNNIDYQDHDDNDNGSDDMNGFQNDYYIKKLIFIK